MTPIPIWQARNTRIGFYTTSKYETNTQWDLKQFRRWALHHGFRLERSFNRESIKRAYKLVGTGDYAGITFSVINRVKLSQDHPSRYNKSLRTPLFDNVTVHRRKIGEIWHGRHNRSDCDIMCDCSIAGFFHSTNLLGYYGLQYRDVMSLPVAKLHEILMQPPRYRKPPYIN